LSRGKRKRDKKIHEKKGRNKTQGIFKIKMPGGGLPGILKDSLWGVSTMNHGTKV